jgi:hypothetical protein
MTAFPAERKYSVDAWNGKTVSLSLASCSDFGPKLTSYYLLIPGLAEHLRTAIPIDQLASESAARRDRNFRLDSATLIEYKT